MNARRLKTALHQRLQRLGFDLVPYSGRYFPAKRRVEAMRNLGVRLVIDVGANSGQWATQVRRDGWVGDIVSLEPLPNAYSDLKRRADRDSCWRAIPVACGAIGEQRTLHVADNAASSSLLAKGAVELAEARYVGEISVSVERLDDTLAGLGLDRGPCYLKIDTQGYEIEVLRGAPETLARSVAVELELSLVEMYEAQPLADDVLRHMLDANFLPISLEPAFIYGGEVLQMDCLFIPRVLLG